MSNYTIQIEFKTGNSFGSHVEDESIGSFETLEEAKEFLKTLKEHHKFSLELGSLRTHDAITKFKNKHSTESWYDSQDSDYSFMYKGRRQSAFYIGYFETLLEAKIIVLEKSIDPDWYYCPTDE